MPSLMDKLQSKLELLRLEKRYTRSRHRRSAFVSNAVYVDGEYVFQQTPSSTGNSSSSTKTSSSYSSGMNSHGIDALHGEKARVSPVVASIPEEGHLHSSNEDPFANPPSQQRKRLNRFSTVAVSNPRTQEETPDETKARKKLNRFSSMPGFGGSHDGSNPTSSIPKRRLSFMR